MKGFEFDRGFVPDGGVLAVSVVMLRRYLQVCSPGMAVRENRSPILKGGRALVGCAMIILTA